MNKGKEAHPLLNSSLKNALGKDFNISSVSLEYCLQKLTLILFTQQIYYKRFKTSNENSSELIDTALTIKDSIRIEYLYEKINNAGSQYGLLCLTEESYLKKSKKEVINNISLNKRAIRTGVIKEEILIIK
jgi:hypothetical protein